MLRVRAPRRIAQLALVILVVALLLPGLATSAPGPGTSAPPAAQAGPQNRILARALNIQRGAVSPRKFEMPLSSGVMNEIIGRFAPAAVPRALLTAPAPATGVQLPADSTQGCPRVRHAPGMPDNVRVNQDCSLRRQAEEVVVVNPTRPNNLIAGQNDSRIGFNHCGYDWSIDGGRSWGDTGTSPPPFWQMFLAFGVTADACSDPTATFDHNGNAYVGGIFFNILYAPSAIFVAKSNAPIGGRFYHTPQPGPFQLYTTTGMGTVASDASWDIFNDKEFIIADSRMGSPKRGRVYVTWTRFNGNTGAGVGMNSPIYFSQSTDGGATWSPGVEISGSNAAVCTVFSGSADPNACDQDQGSHGVVGPDGTIYVVFGNGNTPLPGINQVLFTKCPAANDCSQAASWSAPVKVGDLIGTHPIGDPGNAGGCPVGRQCLPPNGYRVPEFTSMTISVDRFSNLYITWSDFRNGDDPGSTCGPLMPWSAATPPCNNDVFYSFSTNGGATWSATRNVTPPSPFRKTAQWQPWSDVRADGQRLFVAFYDRSYGNCEVRGCNDITLATIRRPRSNSPSISYRRITTSSMPNLVPANNPVQAGFIGDYMWLEVSRHSFAQRDVHIVWADTRPLFGSAPEEDIYYARIRAGESGNE